MTGKELVKVLRRMGFKLDRVSGSHHILVKGDIEVSVPVHAKKDLPAGTLNDIMKRAGLK